VILGPAKAKCRVNACYLKNGKFTGVKEAWEKYYVDVYGGKLKK
jgi:hypothetical protein